MSIEYIKYRLSYVRKRLKECMNVDGSIRLGMEEKFNYYIQEENELNELIKSLSDVY